MYPVKVAVVLLGLIICIGTTSIVQADTTIHLWVNGTEVTCPTLPATPCDMEFPLSNATLPSGTKFTISDSGGGAARIFADDSSSQDTLRLDHATFTATTTFSANSIVFSKMFKADPTTAGGNVVNYNRTALGLFTVTASGALPYATVSVNGRVAGESIPSMKNTWSVTCGTCGGVNLPGGPLTFSDASGNSLPDPRELKFEISNFKLHTAGEKLAVSEFSIVSSAGAGGDGASYIPPKDECPIKQSQNGQENKHDEKGKKHDAKGKKKDGGSHQ